MDDLRKALAEALKTRGRKAYLAGKLGVDPRTIYNWAQGNTEIDAAKMNALADLLEVPAVQFTADEIGAMKRLAAVADILVAMAEREKARGIHSSGLSIRKAAASKDEALGEGDQAT